MSEAITHWTHYIRFFQAIQYDSDQNSWNGFIVDIYKAKNKLINVSSEANNFFSKYANNSTNLSQKLQNILANGSFDTFIKKTNLQTNL